ncbi:UDP-glycosyltransferase 92A1 [Telopea speciosissima]|uniref:UDP-glycosyltransferase 92A1 n=1 Tax=Telopea speciosissima TaxID=54955 RepID=UPI001CC605ED|nr:UDP-glycosyltransferase 92A1 [Telopea speciosissima]
MAQKEENVVIFPFMAQGHMIPFLSLALQIEQKKGYTVTFVNTPLNIEKLRHSLPPTSTIRFVSLPFSAAEHDLPPEAENTDVLPYPLIVRLFHASLSLKPSFTQLISELSPLCIIADMFFGWTAEVANQFGVFHSIFNAGGAYGMALYRSVWLHLPHCNTDSDEFSLPDLPEISPIHRSQLSNNVKYANGTDPWSVFIQGQVRLWFSSDGLLFNTVGGIDQTGLSYFRRKKTGIPVWAIGPTSSPLTKKAGNDRNRCIDWLDTCPQDSVLYVSFGSQNTISATQMMELAKALELSGKNFIWVVRPPIEFDINLEFTAEKWLPEGFEDRIKEQNRGLLVRKWAPQVEILSHKSTRAFISHCGWNSVLESLSQGVPILAWPIGADQFYNAKFLEEEVGVCVEMARGNSSEVKHEHILKLIELVMCETEKGEKMKKRACEVKEIIRDAMRDEESYRGSSLRAMDEFFDAAISMKTRKETQE